MTESEKKDVVAMVRELLAEFREAMAPPVVRYSPTTGEAREAARQFSEWVRAGRSVSLPGTSGVSTLSIADSDGLLPASAMPPGTPLWRNASGAFEPAGDAPPEAYIPFAPSTTPGPGVVTSGIPTTSFVPPDARVHGFLSRLCDLLEMPEQERQFLRSAASAPSDWPTLEVFADWLEERQRPKEAERMRRLTPQTGDLLVVWAQPGLLKETGESMRALADNLRENTGRDVQFVVLPGVPGWDVNCLEVRDGDVLTVAYPPEDTDHAAAEVVERLRQEMTLTGRPRTAVAAAPASATLLRRVDAVGLAVAATEEREACAAAIEAAADNYDPDDPAGAALYDAARIVRSRGVPG